MSTSRYRRRWRTVDAAVAEIAPLIGGPSEARWFLDRAFYDGLIRSRRDPWAKLRRTGGPRNALALLPRNVELDMDDVEAAIADRLGATVSAAPTRADLIRRAAAARCLPGMNAKKRNTAIGGWFAEKGDIPPSKASIGRALRGTEFLRTRRPG